MRLNGLGPSPSPFIQRQGHNHGQVNELDQQNTNDVSRLEPDGGQKEGEARIPQEGSAQTQDPMDDPNVRAEVMELQTIEDKVIAHEQAHQAAGGEFTGGASYGYTVGPDGKRYITSGEVSISVPSTGEPEQLLHAMERVRAAALAPADPSGQDQRVAASATAKMVKLRSEISKQKAAEAYGTGDQTERPENKGRPDQVQELEGPHAQSPQERQHLDLII